MDYADAIRIRAARQRQIQACIIIHIFFMAQSPNFTIHLRGVRTGLALESGLLFVGSIFALLLFKPLT
jgi:hypothetical protein